MLLAVFPPVERLVFLQVFHGTGKGHAFIKAL